MTKSLFIFIAIVCFVSFAIGEDDSRAGTTEHTVYLESTDHELHVFRIFGKKPGKTVLIIGGIHGNEPGGYLAADHYINLALERGNLIVVPRTNLSSILSNHRGHDGDLNRRFSTKLDEKNKADKIVMVLKELMEQSDLVLNLHDGSGFYREKWVDKLHNPYRYGQAVMSDSSEYRDKKTGVVVRLAEIGMRVVKAVNSSISDEEYKFNFANHNSLDPDTKYPEMRKTATYYALTEFGIPAYGVETSKSLPSLDMKVRHQVLVINAFLDEFDVKIAMPAVNVESAKVDYVVFSINDKFLQGVKPGGELLVRSGDKIRLARVISNYESGLFLDYIGQGSKNDNLREVTIKRSVRVVVRKDSAICCSFNVVPGKEAEKSVEGMNSLRGNYFIVDVNGVTKLVSHGDELEVIHGDIVIVKDFFGPGNSKRINVNFQGFVGDPADNRGEDRGYKADTARDLLKNWSVGKKGIRYVIAAKSGRKIVSSFTLKICKSDFKYVIFNNSIDDKALLVRKGDSIEVSGLQELIIEDIITDVKHGSPLKLKLLDEEKKSYRVGDSIQFGDKAINRLLVYNGENRIGSISIIRKKASSEKAAR